MHDVRHGDLHSIGAKLAYADTQSKVLKYAMKQNSDILWYPIKNVDTQFTKKTSSPKGNDRSPESNVPRSNLISKNI